VPVDSFSTTTLLQQQTLHLPNRRLQVPSSNNLSEP
jgi:hypothetical protein